MQILFVHENFPGQFRHLLKAMRSPKNNIVFLTFNKKNWPEIEGIRTIEVQAPNQKERYKSRNLENYEQAILNGEEIAKQVMLLSEKGFNPKLIIAHGGNGLASFIKEASPESILICYQEWFFNSESLPYSNGNNKISLVDKINIAKRNQCILTEIESADAVVVPTQWQKSKFPQAYKEKIKTIFDGVDTTFFKPDEEERRKCIELKLENNEILKVDPTDKILTFATRGMEPIRGFPEFMVAAEAALNTFSDLKVIIAGRDRQCYSYKAPNHSGSWKDFMTSELNLNRYENRIIYTGLLTYGDYVKLLRRSDLHCAFTRPYVTSWSVFEAIACGANICMNTCAALRETANDDKSVHWVDLDNKKELIEKIKEGLTKPRLNPKLNPDYHLENCLRMWGELINQMIKKIDRGDQ